MKDKPMATLQRALNSASYEWLVANHPDIAEAIEVELSLGATPDGIKREVLRRTQRLELALRCQQGAQYVIDREN